MFCGFHMAPVNAHENEEMGVRDHVLTCAMSGKIQGGTFKESSELQQGSGHIVGVNQDI